LRRRSFWSRFLFFNREAIWRGQEIDTDIDPLGFASINPGNDYIYGAGDGRTWRWSGTTMTMEGVSL
jgi:hypothetical protein